MLTGLDIYHWSAGLAVTGRIRDIGQNVLQSSFETLSSNSLSYFQVFLHIAFPGEAFIRNIIIIMCSNYTGTVVKVLRYKSEGRWFDPRCHGIFN
jgi:hypothetical protein